MKTTADEVFKLLRAAYPDARCELDFTSPFQLLVATVLSAQSTDVGVNKVTPVLFARWPTPQALAEADRAELEEVIRPTGFFRNKAAALQRLSRQITDDYDGKVPVSIDDLVKLPGVGRKTANVVRGHAFGLPAITTDTHVLRVSKRLGWTTSAKPEVVETDLQQLFDPSDWTVLSDTLSSTAVAAAMPRSPPAAPAWWVGSAPATAPARPIRTRPRPW